LGGAEHDLGRWKEMKLSSLVCASVLVLATLATSADGAFAGNTIKVPFDGKCFSGGGGALGLGGGNPLNGINIKSPPRPNPCKLQVAPGQGNTLNCTVNGVICTPDQVQGLAASLAAQPGNHITTLTIDKNGALRCGDRTLCDARHLTGLKAAALGVQVVPTVKGGDAAPQK
jgi:hypothetical protein